MPTSEERRQLCEMNPGITEEVGSTTRYFMKIMMQQPLALALVVMNFVLIAYVFYSGSVIIEQRWRTTNLIVEWQKETDKLLQTCVSSEALEKVFDVFKELSGVRREPQPPPVEKQSIKPISMPDVRLRLRGEIDD